MKFSYDWKEGKFLERPNRFTARIQTESGEVIAHVPNTGRLQELLTPGKRCYLSYHPGTSRKTKYGLRIVEDKGNLVSIDSQLPNILVEEAVHKGFFDFAGEIKELVRESTYKNSRFDFSFKLEGRKALMEVKGVTLAINGWGFFPDAPTMRGARHIKEIIDSRQHGYWAAIVFLLQNSSAKGFSPNTSMDPDFSDALGKSVEMGVRVYALQTETNLTESRVTGFCPVIIEGKKL